MPHRKYLQALRRLMPDLSRFSRILPLGGFFLLFASHINVLAQQNPDLVREIDSIKQVIASNIPDTARVRALTSLFGIVSKGNIDTAGVYARMAMELAEKTKDAQSLGRAYHAYGLYYYMKSDYGKALEYNLKALKNHKVVNNERGMASSLNNIGILYSNQGENEQAIEAYKESIAIRERLGDKKQAASGISNLGMIYLKQRRYDDALASFENAIALKKESGATDLELAYTYEEIGNVYMERGKYQDALEQYELSLRLIAKANDPRTEANILKNQGRTYVKMGQASAAIQCLNKSMDLALKYDDQRLAQEVYQALSDAHRMLGNLEMAWVFHHKEDSLKEVIMGNERSKNMVEMREKFNSDLKDQALELSAEQFEQEKKLRYLTIAVLALVACSLIGVYWTLQKQRRTYKTLQVKSHQVMEQHEEINQQKEEIASQRDQLEDAYRNVRTLSDIGKEITSLLSINAIEDMVYHHVNTIMDATIFGIGIFQSEERCIRFSGLIEAGEKMQPFEYSLTEKDRVAVWCFERVQEVFVADFLKEYNRYIPNMPAPKAGVNSASMIYLPLVLKGKTVGVITVQSFKVGVYGQAEVNMLRNLAVYVAIAIDNASAYSNLALEQEKSERLLLNILPEATANELKATGHATPRYYEEASILFADFAGFTQIAEKLTATELVETLDEIFQAFDDIMRKHGLEKIKTIGDAYMCASGIPIPNENHATLTVIAALEMMAFIKHWNAKRISGTPEWQLRIGIHTGPLTAGVVGKHKFAYDIWGDAVNLAARMEQSGEIGQISISSSTYQRVRNLFTCHYKGKVLAKNKGEIDCYLVQQAV